MKKLFSLAMAIVCSASMWAIEPVDGVYKLSTGAEAKEFADGINDGTIAGNSKVELTQDLDLSSVGNWVTIGTDAHKFTGTFDGKGYRIMNMTIDGSKKEQGFFGVAGAGATIKNVIMDASCKIESTGGACLAALIGCCNNDGTITIENCGNEANVSGKEQNNAAFLGCNYGGTKIVFNNCYNTGKISGGRENGAFSGWCGGGATFNNCYNIGEVLDGETWARGNKTINNCYQTVGSDNGVVQTTAEKVASGELAFLLNGGNGGEKWYQKLSDPKDAYPVPFASHGKVYANGAQNCDGSDKGTVVYSNEDTGFNRDPHTDADGFCSVCQKVVPEHLAPVDGYYQIGNATDLRWFASYVMDVDAKAKAKLTANIDYTAHNNGFIGVPGKPFKGEFDGQEHTITIAISNRDGVNRTGLFAAIDGATIKNLAVEGSATSNDQNCVGGLGGRSDGNSTIENVIVKTAVSYTGSNGDATCGGLFANMEGSVTVKNCAFLGSINTGTAEGNGGLVGWAGGGNNNKYINCYVAPTEYTKNGNSADFARNNPSLTNCHTIAPADATLASGEFCYTLNDGGDNWYQALNVDATPVPFLSHGKVYANASYNCDGTPKGAIVYANVNEEQHDPHTLDGGFCSVCNGMIEYIADYMTPAADGAYEISDNKQMRWFSAMIKDYRNAHSITENVDADAPVNARLMNDIDFEGVKDYMPIGGLWGQGSTRYAGTFDGQFHKIKKLVINGGNETGIFGVIATNAIIKNFTVDASCSINGGAHVGVIGEAWKSVAGDIHIEYVGNEAAITGTGNNVGGILGVNMNNSGYAKLFMKNCYSTGAIKGNAENGQLSGWTGDNSSVENCYAIGEITNGDGFGRLGGGSTATNCYSDKELNWGPVKITKAMLASGELCAKLGDKNFRQEIGTDAHPVLSDTKPNVVSANVSAAGYATYVAGEDVKFNAEGLEAYVVSSTDKGYAELADVTAVPAGEAVVLKANEGTYYFNTTTEATAPAANHLVAATADVTANGTQYVLAMPEGEEVGFYRATEGTIAKGKAYLQSNSNVKAFYFDEEIATGIINANVDADANAAIYNLAGQRVSKMQKGINIVDGKKILK